MTLFSQTIQAFEIYPAFFYSTVVIFSLLVGSFLNVVIFRLPKILEQEWKTECRAFLADELDSKKSATQQQPISLAKPNSQCPHCGHQIRFYENIPLISYLLLRGKCSQCHHKISVRYPIIEAITAVLGFIIAQHYGVTVQSFLLLLLTYALISLTMIDVDHMLLPDQITLPFLWLGLLANAFGFGLTSLHDAVIGAAAGYMSLYTVFWLFKAFTGKEGMGFGDFKLFALFGAWAGWQLLPLLILMASVVGALVGISLMLFKNHGRQQAIPFGPYLAVAGWVTILWGENIWAWYLTTLL